MDKLRMFLSRFFASEIEEVKQAALPIIGRRQLLEQAVKNFEMRKKGLCREK